MTEREPKAQSEERISKLKKAVAGLWDSVVDRHLERVTALEEAAEALLEGSLEAQLREQAVHHAHNLAGTLGSFGLIEAGEQARGMEVMLVKGEPLSPTDRASFRDAVAKLRADIEAGPGEESPDSTALEAEAIEEEAVDAREATAGRPLLLIVETDAALGNLLEVEARGRDLETVVATSFDEAKDRLEAQAPDAAVVSLDFSAAKPVGMDLLQDLGERTPPIPTLVLSGRDTFSDRVEAARRGARGFLEKPALPKRILDSVEEILDVKRSADTKVLSVDDDPTVHSILRRLLKREGVNLRGVSDPERFWSVLEQADPDLVILDLNMPGVKGLDLCRVIRNHERWAELPIVVLTSDTDPKTVKTVFDAGADDYLAKPIRIPELVARIQNRVERIKLLRHSGNTDSVTRVASRSYSEDLLVRYLELAKRQGEPMALGMVELDRMDRIGGSYGQSAADRALRHVARGLQMVFRPEDVVGRWSNEQFAVGLYGMTRGDGVARLTEVLEQLREEPLQLPDRGRIRITFTGGVAESPEDGESLQALFEAAEQALFKAREAGRDRVFGYQGGQPDAAREDV